MRILIRSYWLLHLSVFPIEFGISKDMNLYQKRRKNLINISWTRYILSARYDQFFLVFNCIFLVYNTSNSHNYYEHDNLYCIVCNIEKPQSCGHVYAYYTCNTIHLSLRKYINSYKHIFYTFQSKEYSINIYAPNEFSTSNIITGVK